MISSADCYSVYLNRDKEPVLDMEDAAYCFIAAYCKNTTVIESEGKKWSIIGTCQQMAIVHGTVYEAYVIGGKHTYGFYSLLEAVDRTRVHIARYVGATLCGNYRHLFNADRMDNVYQHYSLFAETKCEAAKTFKYVYDIDSKTRQKISQHHHVHVRLQDIFKKKGKITLCRDDAVFAVYLDKFTDNEVTHSTFWTYWKCISDDIKKVFLGMLLTYGGIETNWLKLEGAAAKQMQGSAQWDLSKIFELNVLLNRVDTDVDWDREKTNRTKLNCVKIKYDDVFSAASNMFATAKAEGKKAIKSTWSDYWAQRIATTPGGSVHSKYDSDSKYITEIEREIRSKKSVLASMPHMVTNKFCDRPPMIEAHTSTKYEWGKVRALYGCDLTSHVNADFGMIECENTFPHFVPTGRNANVEYVSKITNSVRDLIPFCYDYDDFNSQHNASSMAAVIDAWLHVYGEQITPEQRDAVMWTSKSCYNMDVYVTATGDWYTAKGTLFSGWRLTTFINTALNYVYLKRCGIDELTVKSIHNGDDVYAGVRNLQDACSLVNNSRAMGIRANTSKMSIGTIAEFLRVDVRAKEKSMSQYLTRSCATVVHGRVETDAALTYTSLARAYNMRAQEVVERGGDKRFMNKILKKQQFFAAQLFHVEESLKNEYLNTDETAGGALKDGPIRNHEIVEVQVGYERVDTEKYITMFDSAIGSYTAYLKKALPECSEFISKKQVEKTIATMFNFGRKTISREPASRGDLYNRKAMRGAWKYDNDLHVVHKIRQGITNTVAVVNKISSTKASILNRSGNPVLWLGILTK